jgi:hypothetical protein
MSLRAEIHSAYDEITPPAPALHAQIRALVASESKAALPSRRLRRHSMTGLRGALALVAALLVILIVATVLVGGQVLHDWNVFTNRPAPAGGGGQTELVQLESRQLGLPTPASHADCRSGPFSGAGSFGKGPIFVDGGGTSTTSWGVYFHSLVYADADINGPILVRASDLFTRQSVVFVGQYAAGPVVGHDTVDGIAAEQRTELAFDTSQALKRPITHSTQKKFSWPFVAGVPNSWSGSTAWQIDGVGFSEVFVAC